MMANLTSMPREIINHILIQENIDMEDVANLGSTCKQLYTAINKDYLWQRKLFQRWPSLIEVHVDYLNDQNIKEIVKVGMKYEKELLYYLSILPYIYNAKDTNKTFKKNIRRLGLVSQTAEDMSSLKYYYCHDKLIKLMEADPLDKHINLTNMYYAKKYIVLMKQIDAMSRCIKLQYLPSKQQTTEKVATLVAQWCQPYKLVSHSDVAASLDIIVQQILKILKDVHPAHSIFATSADQFSFWKNNNITDNYWNVQESRQIIDVIGRVIFREMNFNICCANSEETCIDPKIVFIDQVLKSKRGSLVLLEIIFHSVARRLGVRCDLIYSSIHPLLYWKESYENCTDDYFIDLFSDGSLVSRKDFICHHYHFDPQLCIGKYSNSSCEIVTDNACPVPITLLELVRQLTKNLTSVSQYTDKCVTQSCCVSEFVDMVKRVEGLGQIARRSPLFPRPIVEHASKRDCGYGIFPHWPNNERGYCDTLRWAIYRDYGDIREPNKSDLTDCILSMLSQYNGRKKQSRLTRKHLKYAIGMLVEIESPFKTAGVITGWTSKCSNCHHYLSWPRFDHVSAPTMCTQSYTILACDDRELNVSQELIKPLKMQKWINNIEIGHYFSHFKGTHYVPNQKLQMLYPMDADILKRKYSKS